MDKELVSHSTCTPQPHLVFSAKRTMDSILSWTYTDDVSEATFDFLSNGRVECPNAHFLQSKIGETSSNTYMYMYANLSDFVCWEDIFSTRCNHVYPIPGNSLWLHGSKARSRNLQLPGLFNIIHYLYQFKDMDL